VCFFYAIIVIHNITNVYMVFILCNGSRSEMGTIIIIIIIIPTRGLIVLSKVVPT